MEIQIPILMYHSISDHANTNFNKYTISPGNFREQIKYLHENGYFPITVSQYAEQINSKKALPAKPVILTFDDGFKDFLTEAMPILKEYGFACTLYIPTKYVGTTSLWLENSNEQERPMLDWNQLSQIAVNGIECGGHSHTHAQLDRLPLEKAKNEIVMCKKLLEEHLGREITSFAYPYGYYNQEIRHMLKNVGYMSACACTNVKSRPSDNVFSLPRMIVANNFNIVEFGTLLDHQTSVMNRKVYYLREAIANVLRRRNIYPNKLKRN